VSAWVDITTRRAATDDGDMDPLAQAVVVRMDEFTSKDLVQRKSVVRATLAHLGVLDDDTPEAELEVELQKALAVFSVHSQAASTMSGPK